MRFCCWWSAAFLAIPALLFCQSESPSLGDVARQNRAVHATDATQSKRILENEDVETRKGPIPEISLGKVSNSPEIVKAILGFAQKHSDQETEQVMHEWYDNEITLMRAVIQHRVTITQDRLTPGTTNTIDQQRSYDDYRQYQERQSGNIERDVSDLKLLGNYDQVITRISSRLHEVKMAIGMQSRFDYSWFDADYPANQRVNMPKRTQTYDP